MKKIISSVFLVLILISIVQAVRFGGWAILFGVIITPVLAFNIFALNAEEIVRWVREREFEKLNCKPQERAKG